LRRARPARTGQPERAADALRRLSEQINQGSDWAAGIDARSRALVAEGQEAEHAYVEAIDRLHRTLLPPELARAHLVYGEWLRRENRRLDAREQLRAAHDRFTAMGAHAFAERSRAELLATGEKVRKRGDATRHDLTPQEEHIARLARDGHTNPEIAAELYLSARTVEWHLRKVFTKLGITSRRGLAHRRAGPGPPIRSPAVTSKPAQVPSFGRSSGLHRANDVLPTASKTTSYVAPWAVKSSAV
jgi:DNA-binding CsgD family transcriptional regulator